MSERLDYGPCRVPECGHRAVNRHHVCMQHNRSGVGWHREYVEREDGSTFSYIAKDVIGPPMLVDTRSVVQIIGQHKPIDGRCPGCADPYTVNTTCWVEHVTWGDVWRTSVCYVCAEKAQCWLMAVWAYCTVVATETKVEAIAA